MLIRRLIVLTWALIAVMALIWVSSSLAKDNKAVLQSFEAFQQHYDENQGRHRLVLLADPG